MTRLGARVIGLALAAGLLTSPGAAEASAAVPGAADTTAGTTAGIPVSIPVNIPVNITGSAAARPRADVPGFANAVPATTTQVVRTISTRRWCRKVYCTLTQAWQKDGTGWQLLRQFRSSIGSKGWGKQREGDHRSPVGVYRIKVTFSTGRQAPGPMPWRRRNPTSVVTSAHGPDYNTWLEVPGVRSGDRPSMRWGWVVDYNHVRLTPGAGAKPVPGLGSGIFYHTSKPGHRWAPTVGCTQIGNPRSMRWLVRWLRPGADPRVVQRL